MVRILRVGSLRTDSTVARVVVLPLPVGPVTTIMPCGSVSSPRSFASSAGRKAELFDCKQAGFFRQQTDDGRFAVLCRHDGDAEVELGSRHLDARRAVLWQAAFRDIEAGEDLDAGNNGLRQDVRRLPAHCAAGHRPACAPTVRC